MAKKKSLVKEISREATKRARSEAIRQRDVLKTTARSKLEERIPAPLRWLVPVIEEFRGSQAEEPIAPVPEAPDLPVEDAAIAPSSARPTYPQYACQTGDPLTCPRAISTGTAYCLECGFPARLADKAELRGDRGRYQIRSFLGRRGNGRLYGGIQVTDQQPVVIREYLLPPRCFNPAEMRQRQRSFTQLAGLNALDGRLQEFRLIAPWDAIADSNQERCYLVTKGKWDYPTLQAHLAQTGAMSVVQVQHVLNQVLQTLEFLHGQKFRLPGGQLQTGVAHGNLSLESLLLVPQARLANSIATASRSETDFFIYTCDLALWEHLFAGPDTPSAPIAPAQDLVALGWVAFYLLAGRSHDPVTQQPLDPHNQQQWPPCDPALKHIILRLIGPELPFESATAARQALLQLQRQPLNAAIVPLEPEPEEPTGRRPVWLWLGAVALVAFLAGMFGWWLMKPQPPAIAEDELGVRWLKQVPAVPEGDFTYTAEQGGTWNYVLQQENLILPGRSLETELQLRKPKLKLTFQPTPDALDAADAAVIQAVESEQFDFAVTNQVNELPGGLDAKPIAYDGLVAFVSFSYAKREAGLPQALRGQISVEQLRQLYTGQITTWKALDARLPDLRVKLYVPSEAEAVRVFEQRILKDEQSIAQFRRLLAPPTANRCSRSFTTGQIAQCPTFETLRQVIRDFEDNQIGAIAFGTLSKVFGQCSVYPLALAADGKPPIQALVQDTGSAIDPATDLCSDKGSYHPNRELLASGRYPLAYAIAVIYPRDNSRLPAGEKFADLLRTQEGQLLLKKTGLVPLHDSPSDRSTFGY